MAIQAIQAIRSIRAMSGQKGQRETDFDDEDEDEDEMIQNPLSAVSPAGDDDDGPLTKEGPTESQLRVAQYLLIVCGCGTRSTG
jgi:hypothetical protein